jgi:outer membrane protein W
MVAANGSAFEALAQQQDTDGGKFRIGFSLAGTRTEAEVESEAGNTLFVESVIREPVDFLRDPRNDSAALNALNFGYGVGASLSAAYQFNDRWSVEVGAGYQQATVGKVEVQLQPFGIPPDQQFQFLFDVYGIDAGTLEQVPVDLTIAARFRPKAAVRPFVGFGFGYMFVGFDPSDELNQLSLNMDNSVGRDNNLSGPPFGRKNFSPAGDADRSLGGANIDAPDAWTWHGVAGLEWAFRRNWSFVADFRYVGANKNFSIHFDGRTSLGRGLPQGIQTVPTDDAPDFYPYGAVTINEGGLLDTGGLYVQEVDESGELVLTPCASPATPGCQFFRVPDGENDLGAYYVQGGDIRYSYMGLQVGLRYTFLSLASGHTAAQLAERDVPSRRS